MASPSPPPREREQRACTRTRARMTFLIAPIAASVLILGLAQGPLVTRSSVYSAPSSSSSSSSFSSSTPYSSSTRRRRSQVGVNDRHRQQNHRRSPRFLRRAKDPRRTQAQATLAPRDDLRAERPGVNGLAFSKPAPYREGCYDPSAAETFYGENWGVALVRGVRLGARLGLWAWGANVLDANMGKVEANKRLRAQEMLDIIYDVGPTAIKIGQALSIRADLVDPVYADVLSELQDRVPPFDTATAKEVIEEELGLKGRGGIASVFVELSEAPVAAASIGQVYRGRLKDGREVAVKVQRPGVLQQIALDLHIARQFAPVWSKVNRLNTDFVGLVDEWGDGFIQELDYPMEARNTAAFTAAMRARGLDAVFAPEVVPELTSAHVLTTAWVDGVRLDRANGTEARRLCAVALNAYLTMLLDTGTLHCDPHPGNLLCTPEGRLCVLDFGMTRGVRPDFQYALLEYIAHLTTEDYEKVPDDLINLGFIMEGQEEALKGSGIVEVLSLTLRQLAKGGGAKKTQERLIEEFKAKYGNLSRDEMRLKLREKLQERGGQAVGVADVGRKMEELEKSSPNIFRIPVWMAYILRAFSVLEGIGLKADEDYSIVQECYPYLARRLLTDDHPRANKALKTILYGGKEKLDVKQLSKMGKGFSSYMERTVSVSEAKGAQASVDELVKLALSEEGNFVQRLLIEQVTAVLDASTRSLVSEALQSFPGSVLSNALRTQRSATSNLPAPVRTMLSPLLFPGDLLSSLYPLVEPSKDDQETLDTFAQILAIFEGPNSMRSSETGEPVDAGLGGMPLQRSSPIAAGMQSSLPALTSSPSSLITPGNLARALRNINQTQILELWDRYKELSPGAQVAGLRLIVAVLSRTRERILEASGEVESRAQLAISQQTSKSVIQALDTLLNAAEGQLSLLAEGSRA